MSYNDNLFKGSIRGVPFVMSTADTGGARRYVVHRYPKRDTPYLEDMGRKEREYTIEGFVIGDDAIQQRNNVITALEQEGIATLIHPTYGTIQVGVTNYSARDVMKEGRMARFSFTFIESGKNVFPANDIDYTTAINTETESAVTGNFTTAFTENYTTTGPDFLKISATATVTSAFTMLKNIASVIPPQFTDESLSTFLGDIDLAILDIDGVAGTASAIASLITDTIKKISDLVLLTSDDTTTPSPINNLSQVSTAIELTRFGESSDILINPEPSSFGGTLATIIETTPTRTQERKNQESIIRLVRETALAESMDAAIDVEFESYGQSSETRNTLENIIDNTLIDIGDSDIGDDDAYASLDELRGKIVKGLIAGGADLSRIETFVVPAVVMSSLELAYNKYEDVEREQEIIDRNAEILHPGFLPGAAGLEVLGA